MRDRNNHFELVVTVNGKRIPEYFHQGRLFVEGRESSGFDLEIRNNTSRKVEGIVSVDGRSIKDGGVAGANSGFYHVMPHSSVAVGKELPQTHSAFFKHEKTRSFLGVIGLLVFSETSPILNNGAFHMASSNSFMAYPSLPTWGRASPRKELARLEMYYGSRKELESLGITVTNQKIAPQAFPSY